MPDYSKGKIYTIRCRTDDTLIYVGSTIQPLSKRLGGHKEKSKREEYKNRILYQEVNGNWENWYIELYELYPCNSKEELYKKEGEIIRLIGNLNSRIEGRTLKEYRDDNIEKIKEYKKEYYNDNAEKIKEYKKEWYENNKNIILEQQKEYYENNKNIISEKAKEYYENNKNIISEKAKEYYENNKDKIKEHMKQYNQKNKEKNLEKAKKYYEKNKDKINEKITCQCGFIVCKKGLVKHKKSQKHLNYSQSVL